MKKRIDKYKLTVIALSTVFALSLTVTIVLASFIAGKSGSVTLNFADGLTMVLTPRGDSGVISITGGGADQYTFTYASQSNVTQNLTYDGVVATLNKAGYISYQVTFLETTSGSAVAPAGAFSYVGSYTYQFQPTGERTNWRLAFWIQNLTSKFNVTALNNTLTFVGKNLLSDADNFTMELWSRWAMRNPDNTEPKRKYIDDLGGRSFELQFTIKADTASAPTFS